MTAQKESPASFGKHPEGRGTLAVKWVVSFIGCPRDMRQTIRGLGFRRMQQVVIREDTPATRGMIHKVRHLVQVQEHHAEPPKAKAHEKARSETHEKGQE